MKTGLLTCAIVGITTVVLLPQIVPPAGKTSGPGVQAPADSRAPEVLKACKTPPVRPAAPAGAAKKGGPPAPQGEREYTVTEIPGVIAAGARWTVAWEVAGNNADGFVANKNGDLLIAQNDNSTVIKLDQKGATSAVYTGLNTSGSLAMNKKGAIFVANRGLNPSIEQLVPKRQVLASKYNDDPLDCIGGVLNDMAADSKGGVYFTYGGVFYADPKGKVTKYGQNVTPNGIVLSPDEKTLFVTNAGTLAAFDVQKDGSLTNQREFVKWEGGGGDGSAFDATGRLYVTSPGGIRVISAEGKLLGTIPTPRNTITTTFAGKDRKTLCAIARDNATNHDWIIAIPMIAQGPKGRAK